MKLIDFMEICKTKDVTAVATAMHSAWGLDAGTATASAQQWAPSFHGFVWEGALMGLYGDVQKGEDDKAIATLTSDFKLDASAAATAIAAIRSSFS